MHINSFEENVFKVFKFLNLELNKAIPKKYFASHRPVSCDGGSVGRAKKNGWTLEGVWVPEKAGLLSKRAWLQSQFENVVFSTIKRPKSLQKRSIDVNWRQGHHIIPIVALLIRSCACKLKYLLLWLVNLEFFLLFEKKWVGRGWETKHFIGMA